MPIERRVDDLRQALRRLDALAEKPALRADPDAFAALDADRRALIAALGAHGALSGTARAEMGS